MCCARHGQRPFARHCRLAMPYAVLQKNLARLLPCWPGVMSVHLPDGEIQSVSLESRSIFGYMAAEIKGLNLQDFVHPDDAGMLRHRIAQVLGKDGASAQLKYRFRHKAGHFIWLESWIAAVSDVVADAVDVSGFLIRSRDATQEVKIHQELQNRQIHLDLVHDLAQMAWWSADFSTGKFVHDNGFVRMTGRAIEELEDVSHFLGLFHEDDREEVREVARSMANGQVGERAQVECRLQGGIGPGRWVRMTAVVVERDRRGRPLKVCGAVLDIDDHVMANQRFSDWVEFVDRQRLEERTTMAYQLHDEVGQSMTGLKWQLEWLASQIGLPGRKTAKRQELLLGKVQEMTRHIDDAMLVLRNVSRNLKPRVYAFGLRAAVAELVDEFRLNWLRNTRVELKVTPPLPTFDDWFMATFMGMLREMLNNIVRHAKASEALVSLAEKSGCLTLIVADNGVGLEGGAEASGDRLGLAGLRERARLLHAQLDIASSPGRGVQLSLKVPLRPTTTPTGKRRAAA